jgi:ribosomal protein S18 acetylase RimI-like enzyme
MPDAPARVSCAGVADQIDIRRLAGDDLRDRLDELAEILADCVGAGASVGFMAPFSQDEARTVFEGMVAEAERGRRLILGAFVNGRLVGTVQLILELPPNQPHRAEITKLLVHSSARKRGIAQRLMDAAEGEAQRQGKSLLVLDAVTGGDAARLYSRLGWTTVGVIPNYALYPDGRPCDTTVFFKAI